MAKRKTKPTTGAGKKPDAHRAQQVPLRVDDTRLIKVLAEFAAASRRSRNMTMILLLEEALTARGLWPPPSPEES